MKWLEIGTVDIDDKNNAFLVNLHTGYEKALNKLDMFSHCMLYFLMEDRIELYVTKILEINEKMGQLILQIPEKYIQYTQKKNVESKTLETLGQLIDIKPYYPAEEVVLKAKEPKNRFCINYLDNFIGEYKVYENRTVIQLEKKILKEIEYCPDNAHIIKKGDYIRVLWWFHRFDKDSFRKNRMCSPPYNNAPKMGIFATRSPVRPNPIGSTVVQVEQVDYHNGIIDVNSFDGFPGTKIFQIMFYQPLVDKIEGATLPPWVSHWTTYKSFDKPKEIDISSKELLQDAIIRDEHFEFCGELELADIVEDEYDDQEIHIHNAHIHNLKNVSVSIPKNSVNLITGVSGSGKSSLAFDTIYAESQKQFMDLVLSNQMLNDTFSDVHVDKITGLQPAIAIEQRTLGVNPRSTVGTVTKIADILKLLFVTIGERLCPKCHKIIDDSNVCKGCGEILLDRTPQLFSYNNPDYMCPICKGLGVEMQIDEEKIVEYPDKSLLDCASSLYGNLRKHRKKPNANWMRGEILALADDLNVDLELPFSKLPDEFKQQFFYGSNEREVSLSYENLNGRSGVITRPVEGAVNIIQRLIHDTKSTTMTDQIKRYMSKKTCSQCQGERLREEGRLVNIYGYRYPEVMKFSIDQLRVWCHKIYGQLMKDQHDKTKMLFIKLNQRLKWIQDVGLSYITLDRSVPSLSGGEAQRLKLATQFGTGLSNILYIMDEPSKGLHPKDYRFLMDTITDLKKHGNTVILVEHKKIFMTIADMHFEMGPKAGRYGGELISVKYRQEIEKQLELHSYNDDFNAIEIVNDLSKDYNIENGKNSFIQLKGVTTHNLKCVDVAIPIGMITAVIGVSGSGKSSLISKTLYPYIMKLLGRTVEEMGTLQQVTGVEVFEDVCYVNQKPIGSNSRSNPGTYTGVFDLIRKCYAGTKQAKSKNLSKEFFSFNSKKGQCPECSGLGEVAVNMHYMDDFYVTCNKCHGKRYSKEVLEVKRKGLSIGDILEFEIHDLIEVFQEEKEIVRQLSMLDKVGLGYLKLGQSASTLSGGEAQRIKLAKELYKKDCKNILYILDEPTTGLHEEDAEKVIAVLMELKEKGATIIIIEHNLKMINACDYIVELGPRGGNQGGYIIKVGYKKK
ncbi:TrmO family methyltransferase domain-containing protein [Sedimentibacter sp. MB31-C6]|uniref:TrmO family methyltransferase domain-containing protein n=1 Tax=Sedimentibacter sp. MB31-C6 TaxID=3109366 RepID=UPI002DDD230A|nr:TrmO family methyltransferase [Sedimentibacter sp. MB36-C1]WSI03196.1 TrmO family methyltransferase [Sedimentibacter sp. MB36-C1]